MLANDRKRGFRETYTHIHQEKKMEVGRRGRVELLTARPCSLNSPHCHRVKRTTMKRSYEEEKAFITREDGQRFRIDPGFVPNMKVSCRVQKSESSCPYGFSTDYCTDIQLSVWRAQLRFSTHDEKHIIECTYIYLFDMHIMGHELWPRMKYGCTVIYFFHEVGRVCPTAYPSKCASVEPSFCITRLHPTFDYTHLYTFIHVGR